MLHEENSLVLLERGNGEACLRRIAIVGNHLPRQCGIATFTTDVCEALASEFRQVDCFALPVNDTLTGYEYPPRVRFEVLESDLPSYQRAADFLNINEIDLVCLQHEYGIFGGRAGSHILALLRELRMPVVTTLHTVLRHPDAHQRYVLEEIADLSDRLIVMSARSREFLRDVYGISEGKVDFIPHGIPDMPFVDPNFYKDRFGTEGKLVLLTFGLLSRNKGIENVILALPEIVRAYPNVAYIVLGATHPNVQRQEGEQYRIYLERLARELGVEQNVIFHNRFVALEELVEFIGGADIYITPYCNEAQAVSGTLAYALGAGKAVISTPYWYAQEMLADGRGVLVPFRNPGAIAEKTIELLSNEAERHAMRKRAYLYGRAMVWREVARAYMTSFERARASRKQRPRAAFSARTLDKAIAELPVLKLDHLRRMTDDTGILQHAVFTVPDYKEGYATDDNARALIFAVMLEQSSLDVSETALDLSSRYLGFLWYAFEPNRGRFRALLNYERTWDGSISEDSHGRALWALGTVLGRSKIQGLRGVASRAFDLALPAVTSFTSPRAWAFALLGIQEYLSWFSGDRAAQNARATLIDRLLQLYQAQRSSDWVWFEDVLAYSNARIPQALLVCGQRMSRTDAIEVGLNTLGWLSEIQTCDGHFVPIGSNGFYRRGQERARFDQQPIEAAAMVSACLEAYRITGDPRWRKEAQLAFDWFLGRNDLGLSLYDASTGGCRDGLHPDRANENQGAESTLSFLLALLEMRLAEAEIGPDEMGNGTNRFGAEKAALTTPPWAMSASRGAVS
jgi:glycosyltransferase involved in cell wall biosynthesis